VDVQRLCQFVEGGDDLSMGLKPVLGGLRVWIHILPCTHSHLGVTIELTQINFLSRIDGSTIHDNNIQEGAAV
jgi:hypothetical protein